MSLLERKDPLVEQLAELRRARGAALLDTGALPATDGVSEVEHKLRVIEDAETEQVRRERAAAAEAEAARRDALRSRIVAAQHAHLACVAQAEAAARAFATAQSGSVTALREMNECMATLGGPRPVDLEPQQFERRQAGRISAALKSCAVRLGNHFGELALRIRQQYDGENWRAAEEQLCATGLAFYLPSEKEMT